jgi:hypothetical protein
MRATLDVFVAARDRNFDELTCGKNFAKMTSQDHRECLNRAKTNESPLPDSRRRARFGSWEDHKIASDRCEERSNDDRAMRIARVASVV